MFNNFYGSHEVYTLSTEQRKFLIVVDDDYGYRFDKGISKTIKQIVSHDESVPIDLIVQRRDDTPSVEVDIEYGR